MNETPRRIIRNTVMNALGFGFLFVSNLFLLPYVIHSLGHEYYGGVWVIMGVLIASIGLLDLGTGMAFVKFISEFHTRNETSNLLEVVNTGIALYAAIGIFFLFIAWYAGQSILELIGVPDAIMADAVFVLRVGMLVFVIANVASPLTSVLTGIQRIDITSYVSMGVQALNIAGTIAVLSGGFGVRGLILNNLVIALVSAVSLSWLAFRNVPSLTLAWRHCTMTMMKRFFRYGANLQVSKLAQVILFQTDRIIVLRFFGEITNTHYDIGAKVDNATRSITSLILSALVPAVAELDAKQSQDTIIVLYKRGSKYIAVVATLLFVFVGLFAPQIIRVWMKEPYPVSVEIVRILAIGYFFNVVTGIASSLAAGVGKTEFDRKFGLLVSTLNIVATIGLSLLLGPAGVALGTSLSLVLGGFYFLYLFNGYLKVRMAEVMGLMLKPAIAGMAAGIGVWLLSLALPGFEASRIMGGVLIGGLFAVYTCVFISLLALFGVLDDYDRQMIRVFIRRVL